MALAKGVVDLVDQRRQGAVSGVAEVDAERIEDVTERARHAEKPDRAAVEIDAAFGEQRLGLRAQRRRASVAVIAVVEAEQRAPVVREEVKLGVEPRQFVEVDQQPVEPIAEAMRPRGQAAMEHRADIEA